MTFDPMTATFDDVERQLARAHQALARLRSRSDEDPHTLWTSDVLLVGQAAAGLADACERALRRRKETSDE